MKIIKSITYISILSMGLFSCQKSTQKILPTVQKIKTKTGSFLEMQPNPMADLPKLSNTDLQSKQQLIFDFYNKNWKNMMNGSFLVAQNGQIIFEKYDGFADYELQKSITPQTPLHIASVSKVLTATLILKLIDQKKLDLDQKVNTLFNLFPYPEITIKTLLNHRSGLRNYAYFTAEKGIWDKHKILTNQDILDILIHKNIQLEFPTDSRFSYCNTNYALLALVIEKITGLTYADAMNKMLFKPLQMKNTYVFDYQKDKDTATPSYKGNFRKVGLDYLDGIYGDKNIFSTPRDLLQLDLARRSPNFVHQNLQEAIYRGYSYENRGAKNYGLGIRMIEWTTGETPFYFHNGWWHGSTSSFITLGKENVTIISLSNKFNHETYKVKYIATYFGDYPFKIKDSLE